MRTMDAEWRLVTAADGGDNLEGLVGKGGCRGTSCSGNDVLTLHTAPPRF